MTPRTTQRLLRFMSRAAPHSEKFSRAEKDAIVELLRVLASGPDRYVGARAAWIFVRMNGYDIRRVQKAESEALRAEYRRLGLRWPRL